MSVVQAIEMMASGFADLNQPFDIDVALFGLSYRFPAMTREELKQAVIAVLGDKAHPPRRPIDPPIASARTKRLKPPFRVQVTWQRKAS